MILRKDMFSGGMFVMEDYLLPGGMHPDLKKFLCRDDSQRRNASGFDEIPGTQNAAVSAGQNSIRNCPDRRFPKQNTIPQFYFRMHGYNEC